MNHLGAASIVFMCVFGSALVGLYVRNLLPEHHLSDESVGVVKLATGLIATMAALVLGLLVSSASRTFDTASNAVLQNAANVIQFDHALAKYGPDTQAIRTQLKDTYAGVIQLLASGDKAQLILLGSSERIALGEDIQRMVEELSPNNDSQRKRKAHALQIADKVFDARWLTLLQAQGSIQISLLIALVTWLSIIFGTFGLFAPHNGTIITVLLMCALSAAGAIFIIAEMTTPLDGIIRVSVAPMRDTLALLGG